FVELPALRLRETSGDRRPHRAGRSRQLRHESAASLGRAGELPGHDERHGTYPARAGTGQDDVRAPRLHAGIRRGAIPPAAAEHGEDRFRRGLPWLGIPRGWLRFRRGSRRRIRSDVVNVRANASGDRALIPATENGAALYTCRLRHVRTEPIRNDFTYRTYLWLIDLDQPPRMPGPLRFLAGFRASDHLGDPALSLRQNVDQYLAQHEIDLSGGRVLMLAGARVFGHVFNPQRVL